jgi:hypothetical protein
VEPRRNFAVRNSSTREPWLFRSPVFGSGIRRPDGEAAAPKPPSQPRQFAVTIAVRYAVSVKAEPVEET